MFRIFNQYVSAKSILLMFVESALIVLSLVCAVKLRFWNNPADFALYTSFPDFAVQSGIVTLVCVACFYCNDLYDLSAGSGSVDQVLRIEQSLGAASLLLGLLYFLFPSLLLGRGVFIIGMILVAALVALSRRFLVNRIWQLNVPAFTTRRHPGNRTAGASNWLGKREARRGGPRHEIGGLCQRLPSTAQWRNDFWISGSGVH